MSGLVGFLIYALIVLVIAYVVWYILKMIPNLPGFIVQIAGLIIALVCFILLLNKGLPLLGVDIGL